MPRMTRSVWSPDHGVSANNRGGNGFEVAQQVASVARSVFMTSLLYRRLSASSVLSRYCWVVNACRLPTVICYDTILMLFRSTSPLGIGNAFPDLFFIPGNFGNRNLISGRPGMPHSVTSYAAPAAPASGLTRRSHWRCIWRHAMLTDHVSHAKMLPHTLTFVLRKLGR